MGKESGRLLLIPKIIFKYLSRVINRIFKTFIQSVIICVPIVFTFMIINVCLGVHMKFSFYSKLAGRSTLLLFIGLCIVRYEAIFIKHAKTSKKKTVPTNIKKKNTKKCSRKKKKNTKNCSKKKKNFLIGEF